MSASRLVVLVAWAALALGGCKAEFTSGVTVCGDKEPRCPAGFVCMNGLRCVKGDVAVERTDGGKDTGSTGGSGGAGGSGVGGAGGQGGTSSFGSGQVDAATAKDAPVAPDAPAMMLADAGAIVHDAGNSTDAAVVPVGQAVVKFCNALRKGDGTQMEMELVVGSMRFKAGSIRCTPTSGAMCPGMPAGPVNIQLLREGQVVATQQMTLESSGQYFFESGYDSAAKMYVIKANKLPLGQKCSDVNYQPVAFMKFCHNLVVGDMNTQMPVDLDLVVGTTKVTATTGQCNTMDGWACTDVRTGMQKVSLQRNGAEVTSTTAMFEPDAEYAIRAVVEPGMNRPSLSVVKLPREQTCASYKPPAPPPPADAGAGG